MSCPNLSRLALGVVSTGAVDDVLTEIAQDIREQKYPEAEAYWKELAQVHNLTPVDIEALRTARYPTIGNLEDIFSLEDELRRDIDKGDYYHVQGNLCLLIRATITEHVREIGDFKNLLIIAFKLGMRHDAASSLEASCIRLARVVALRLDPIVEAKHPDYGIKV